MLLRLIMRKWENKKIIYNSSQKKMKKKLVIQFSNLFEKIGIEREFFWEFILENAGESGWNIEMKKITK
jgi:hypothetical protein